jgi:molybdate transport system substrate-binding protein
MAVIARRAFVLALLITCGVSIRAQPNSAPEVIVFSASSLTDVMRELAASYEKKTGVRVTLSFAASSALARQIENGAPAQVFVSADEDWMNYLSDRQLIVGGTRVDIARARLVLIAPADSRVQLKIAPGFRLREALAGGRLAVADPASVPAGKYAKAALEDLGVWGEVSGSLVQAENVRSALMFVGRGEAPLGVVYDTDARADERVRVVDVFPDTTHPPIRYPIALTRNAAPAAQGFVDHVRGSAGQSVFRKYGFAPPQ